MVKAWKKNLTEEWAQAAEKEPKETADAVTAAAEWRSLEKAADAAMVAAE